MALTLQDDMDNIFLDSGFEEDIVYTPAGGVAKPIPAIVFREGSRQHQSTIGTNTRTTQRQYELEILISTDATNGIATVTPRQDKVTVAKRPGDTPESFIVAGVVQADAGALRLSLGS